MLDREKPDENWLKLLGYQRGEFQIASDYQKWHIRMQSISVFLAIAAIFSEYKMLSAICAIVLLFIFLYTQYAQHKIRVAKGVAEEIRRTLLVAEALGIKISDTTCLELQGRCSTSEQISKMLEDNSWYRSNSNYGYRRMGEMLIESSHFSLRMAIKSEKRMWVRFAIFFAATLSVLLISMLISTGEAASVSVQAASLAFSFILSAEVLGMALRYNQLVNELRNITTSLDHANDSGFPAERVVLLFGHYNAAVESAPLFLPGIYDNVRAIINSMLRLDRGSTGSI